MYGVAFSDGHEGMRQMLIKERTQILGYPNLTVNNKELFEFLLIQLNPGLQ